MRIRVSSINLQNVFAFILPTAIILSQWLSVAGISLSWVLYVFLFLLVFLRLDLFRQNPGFIVFGCVIVVVPIVTYPFGISADFQFGLYFSILTGLATFFYICFMDEKEYSAFIKGVLFSCMFFSVWGCYEIFTGNYLFFSNDAFFKKNWVGMNYPGVAFANTNDLVQYLVLLFPISGYLLLKRSKWIFGAFTIIVVFVTYQAGSKLGMSSIIIIMLLASAISTIIGKKVSQSINKLIIFAVSLLLFLWLLDIFTGVISSIFDNFLRVDTDSDYYTGRANIYIPLLRFISTHPLGGFGSSYSVTGFTPHNLILFIFCDFGWLPGFVFVFVTIRMVIISWKKIKEQERKAFWCLMFACVCVFVLTSSISSCNEQRKAVWMFLGICVRNVYVKPFDCSEKFESRLVKFTLGGN